MKKLVILCLLLLISVNQCFAQSQVQDSAKKPVPVKAAVAPAMSALEIAMLKSEKDHYEKMYNQAQQTVTAAHADFLWSLAFESSIVLAVVAFLLGAQYLNNIRINKQEIASFENKINSRIDAIDTVFQTRLNELSSALATQAHLNQATSKNVFKQLNNTIELIRANLQITNDEYFNALRSISQIIESIDDIDNVPNDLLWMLHNCLNSINELHQSEFDRINKIKARIEQSDKHSGDWASFFQYMAINKPVYVVQPGGKKVYIRNEPTT